MSPTPRGMRDFSPETMILRKSIFSRIESIFERFGFDPLETPIVELWETMKGKYGNEAENKLLYYFKDKWGGRELALRYDLTVPLARYMAENKNMPMPFCRYHIGRVYRYDRPQKGRYREFWQCDADLIGTKGPEAEALILNLTLEIMKEFNFEKFTIKLNDRRLLRGIFEKELQIKNIQEIYTQIDKLDKIGEKKLKIELEKLINIEKVNIIMNLLKTSEVDPIKKLDNIYEQFKIPEVKEAIDYLKAVLKLVPGDKISIDLGLVRGLSYYTGPIFETVVSEPKIGSITGGGRYDGLIEKYGGNDLPAVGFSIGVERLIDAGLELGIFKTDKKTMTEVGIVDMGVKEYTWKVAKLLRDGGIKTRSDLMNRKGSKQRDYYKKLKIPVIIYLGNNESKEETATIVFGNSRKTVKLSELLTQVKTILKS